MKIKRICQQCGEEFEMPYVSYSKGRFCSSECYHKLRGNQHPNWKCITKICKECGEIFEILPSRIKRGQGKFCSKECQAKWQSKNMLSGKKSLHWKGGKIKRICEECGEEFEVYPYKIRIGEGNYCSNSCKRRQQKNFPKHHTKPELIFEEICKKYELPYKYTGDGSFWIGSLNPDFVECNGKKIAIEIFSYHHNPLQRFGKVRYSGTYEGRRKLLKQYGWKMVVFWESDLKREDTEQFVLNTLKVVAE